MELLDICFSLKSISAYDVKYDLRPMFNVSKHEGTQSLGLPNLRSSQINFLSQKRHDFRRSDLLLTNHMQIT